MDYSSMVNAINNAIKNKGLKLDGIDVSSKMAQAITKWALMYQDKAPWIGKECKSAGIPASIASEMARLVTIELKATVDGDNEKAKLLNSILQDKILTKLRKNTEYGVALGGMVFKPYPANGKISIQCNKAYEYYPITFDSDGNITQCAFTEQITRGRTVYTRIELHSLNEAISTVTVDNLAFMSNNTSTLGNTISLEQVPKWADIAEHAELHDTDKLLCGFFIMPLTNVLDPNSALGMSIYGRSIPRIHEADVRYTQISWEYESKETAIHASSSMFKQDKYTGKPVLPKGKEKLYREVEYSTGASDKPFMDAFSPEIRDESYYNGYNHLLRMIEFECGLAYGSLSDANDVDKTAEEIKASKQRSFSTVADIQEALEKSLRDLISAIDYWITNDESVKVPDGDYTVTFEWSDSVVNSKDDKIDQWRQDVAMGVMSLVEYRMLTRGETEEEAKAKIPQIADIDGNKDDV